MHDVHYSRACCPDRIKLYLDGHDTLSSLNSVTHLSSNQPHSALMRQSAPLCSLPAECRSIFIVCLLLNTQPGCALRLADQPRLCDVTCVSLIVHADTGLDLQRPRPPGTALGRPGRQQPASCSRLICPYQPLLPASCAPALWAWVMPSCFTSLLLSSMCSPSITCTEGLLSRSQDAEIFSSQ